MDAEAHVSSLRQATLRLSQYCSASEISLAERSTLSVRLVDMHCTLWQLTGERADLESAVAALKKALLVTTRGSEQRLYIIASLGSFANEWYLESDSREVKDDILEQCKTVLPEIPAEDEVLNLWYTTIMKMLRTKYIETKDIEALEQAAGYGRKALNDYAGRVLTAENTGSLIEENMVTADTPQQRPSLLLSNRSGDLCFFLSSLLHDLFLAKSKRDKFLLKEADIYSELAISNTQSPEHVDLFSQQRFHSLILLYEVTSSQPYLDKAKFLARSRLAYFSASTGRRKWLIYLAGALTEEYKHSLKLYSIDEGIRLYREALTIDPPDGDEGVEETIVLHHDLADALLCRNELSLDKADSSLKDMDEALEHVNIEMSMLSSDPSAEELLYTVYGLRGQIYIFRFQCSKSQLDLDCAVTDIKECKKRMDPDSMYQSEASYSLALALLLSNTNECNEEGADYLLEIWQRQTLSRGLRILAAIQLSRYYNERKDWQRASEMMDNAMELLPTLQSSLQVLSDLENSARRFSNFTSEACALALQAGLDPIKAIDRLELSRASILTRLLNQKDEIRELKESIYREDAATYLELREMLSKRPDRMPLRGMQADAEVAAIKEFDESEVEMEELLRKIRSRPGFKRFLLGPSEQQLCDAVSTGYIIVVNMTKMRSDAIIITSNGLRSIELTSLHYDAAVEWLKKAPTQYERPAFRNKNIEFRRFLAWLWRSCVKNILAEILKDNKHSQHLPRVWWMGLGPCAYFPFHAAGIHDGLSKEYTLSSVVSSYIPTLRSFINAKSQAGFREIPIDKPSVLIVEMRTTPGLNDLPGVVDEEACIRKFAGSKLQLGFLRQCTSEEVLKSLEDYEIVHFACHGISDSHESGLDSSLVLQIEDTETREVKQDKLYVQQIYDKQSKRGRLAYLSACSTAHLADARMIDEGVHLVSSFMIAGFTHVVGTLWVTLDHFCVKMADHFYEQYFTLMESEKASDDVALALHRAMVEIRNAHPRQPLGWAPYVHYGI